MLCSKLHCQKAFNLIFFDMKLQVPSPTVVTVMFIYNQLVCPVLLAYVLRHTIVQFLNRRCVCVCVCVCECVCV